MPTRVKFCGAQSAADVELARAAGADAFGMIFGPSSRRITIDDASAIASANIAGITPVGVFVDPDRGLIDAVRALFPDLVVQLSGNESAEFVAALPGPVIKAIHVDDDVTDAQLEARCNQYGPALVMFDTKIAGSYGGSGKRFDWSKIANIAKTRPIIVAGGLTAENVGECVSIVRPAWVDVRSGIESDGRKDPAKMKRFVTAVRENDAT
jgi:phosphoribosylanthranilate isomerase